MKTIYKVLIGCLIAGCVVAVYVYFFMIHKPQPDYEKIRPVCSVTAADLYKSFKDNRQAAQKKFGGQVIEINGPLTKVESADSLVIAVFAIEQGAFGDQGIRCTMLPKFKNEAAKLQPSGNVRIKGYCTGFNDSDVILEHCSLWYINQ